MTSPVAGLAHRVRPDRPSAEAGQLEFERVVLFSDAVFAIAITLLVVDLHLPAIPAERVGAQLPAAMSRLFPDLLAYFLSFSTIGLFWLGHHRVVRMIARFDGVALGLNLLMLAFVAFLPFPTSVLGEYAPDVTAVVFYAAVMTLGGLVFSGLWFYVTQRGLVVADLERSVRRYYTLRALRAPVVFGLSIPLAYVSAALAMWSWSLMFISSPWLWWLATASLRPRRR